MFDAFTDRARKVLALAVKEAEQFRLDYVGTEHLLLGLAKEGNGVARTALNNCGVTYELLGQEIVKLYDPAQARTTKPLPFVPQAKAVIEAAIGEAHRIGHPYAGTEHLLLALLHHPENAARQILVNCGSSGEAIEIEIMHLLGIVDRDASGDPAQHPGIPDYLSIVKQLAQLVLTAFDEGMSGDRWHYSTTARAEYERLEKLSGIEFPKPRDDL